MSQQGHMRKRKDKNGRTRYQMIVEIWKNGRKFYKSKTCDSEKQARAWANKIRYEIDHGIVTKESLKRHRTRLTGILRKLSLSDQTMPET